MQTDSKGQTEISLHCTMQKIEHIASDIPRQGVKDHLLFEYDEEILHDPLSGDGIQPHSSLDHMLDLDIDSPSSQRIGNLPKDKHIGFSETAKRKGYNNLTSSCQGQSSKQPRIEQRHLSSGLLPEFGVDFLRSTIPDIAMEEFNPTAVDNASDDSVVEATAPADEISHIGFPRTSEVEINGNISKSSGAASSNVHARVLCTVHNCSMDFSYKYVMLRHRRTQHGFKFKCNRSICNEEFESQEDYKLHMSQNHSNNARHLCGIEECALSFATRTKLKLHRSARHPTTFKCQHFQCNATLESDASRAQHVATVHGVLLEPYCKFCGGKFYNGRGVKFHIRQVHYSVTDRCKFKCMILGCNALFETDNLRSQHVASQHQNMPDHRCTLCGGRFLDARSARIHATKVHKRLNSS